MERAAPGHLGAHGLDRPACSACATAGTAFQGVQMGSSLAASAFLGHDSPELAMWSVDSFGLDAAWDDEDERARWDGALRALHTGAPDVLRGAGLGDARTRCRPRRPLQAAGYVPANGAVYPRHATWATRCRTWRG